jgi:hypothetical protein
MSNLSHGLRKRPQGFSVAAEIGSVGEHFADVPREFNPARSLLRGVVRYRDPGIPVFGL